MQKYFFHKDRISSQFLELDENEIPFLYNFFYTEYRIDAHKPIFILSFIPTQGKKGLIASDLKPTNILMNTENSFFNITITNLDFEHFSISYYDNHPNYGAIAREYQSNVWLYYFKIGGYGKGKINVRQAILDINERQKMTDSLVGKIRNKIVGMQIKAKRILNKSILNPDDRVFYGDSHKHSAYQIMINQQIYQQNLEEDNLLFDREILRL
jgi:hypothetical protein